MKLHHKFILIFVLIGCLCIVVGCKDSGKKFKVPVIKMITSENVHGVIAPDDDHIWITGNYGIIYHSSDGGMNWTKQDSGVKEGILVDGSFVDNKTGWITGLNGVILHTEDGGENWIQQETGSKRKMTSLKDSFKKT